MRNETVDSASENDFAKELIGKKIVELTEQKVTLSDGTTLEIVNARDCCAWFDGVFRAVNLEENVVTSVKREDLPDVDDHYRWVIHIYSAHKEIAAVDIEGDPTSGYYGSSVDLVIQRPQVAVAESAKREALHEHHAGSVDYDAIRDEERGK